MIVKKDGTKVRVNIGENENDPVFVITDFSSPGRETDVTESV